MRELAAIGHDVDLDVEYPFGAGEAQEVARRPHEGAPSRTLHRLDGSSEDRASLDVAVRREDVPADRHAPRPLADAIEAEEGARGRRLHTLHRSADDLSAVCRTDVRPRVRRYTSSNTRAEPMPPPAHMATHPIVPPRRRSSNIATTRRSRALDGEV